jgi:hypothetical protein
MLLPLKDLLRYEADRRLYDSLEKACVGVVVTNRGAVKKVYMMGLVACLEIMPGVFWILIKRKI